MAEFLASPVPAREQPATALPTGPPATVLLLGLCGSLTPDLAVGDIVLYDGCVRAIANSSPTNDSPLIPLRSSPDRLRVCHQLQGCAQRVRGMSCDRILCTAREKQQLGQQIQRSSRGYGRLCWFCNTSTHWTSPPPSSALSADDCNQDLPDLSAAFSSSGELQLFPLVRAMARQPQAALQLIRSSLQALAQLKGLTATLFREEDV